MEMKAACSVQMPKSIKTYITHKNVQVKLCIYQQDFGTGNQYNCTIGDS
jgi:hypothetical protein